MSARLTDLEDIRLAIVSLETTMLKILLELMKQRIEAPATATETKIT